MKSIKIAKFIALLAAVVLPLATLVSSPAQASGPVVAVPDKQLSKSTVGIQMFMYNWDSIATECTSHLGPAGIDWVQISPPQEHVVGDQWWVHYQPVSYKLDSNLGNRAQFINMVQKCNAAGVMIIADAVINHMANTSGTGYAGTDFEKYSYPSLYSPSDFHSGLSQSNPNYCDGNISSYDDIWETTHCELGGLPDLATEKTNVREKIAAYLNDLIDIGVAGFRVDAAKHFGSADLGAVTDMLHLVNGRKPIVMSEVIGGADANAPFVANGNKVWAWDMPNLLANNMPMGSMGFGMNLGWTSGFNGSSNTITMVTNHDTEHHGPSSLAYWQGNLFQLAHVYMLAVNYGIPELYAGYSFSEENSGPNTNNVGAVANAKCNAITSRPAKLTGGQYTCLNRWRAIQGMIAWRDNAGNSNQLHSTYTRLAIARTLSFNRGDNWIAMNASGVSQKATYRTRLPKGTYCDVISGGRLAVKSNKTCLGTSVVVNSTGYVTLAVPAQSAIAIGKFTKVK